jgi:hypothetical protein
MLVALEAMRDTSLITARRWVALAEDRGPNEPDRVIDSDPTQGSRK